VLLQVGGKLLELRLILLVLLVILGLETLEGIQAALESGVLAMQSDQFSHISDTDEEAKAIPVFDYWGVIESPMSGLLKNVMECNTCKTKTHTIPEECD